MPWLGLGTYRIADGEQVEAAVGHALQVGYRRIDTAALYANEPGIGRAVRASDIGRERIFVTTKVWNSDQGYDATRRAFDRSLANLGFDYVDLYLVHWPVRGKYKETWRALEAIHREGRARAIGVANFLEHHLDDLLSAAQVAPMVDQVECHPYLSLPGLREYCRRHGIQAEAWAPLMRGRLDDPALASVAERHGRSVAQVVLRWDLQHGILTIPKSVHPGRIAENAGIFDFELTAEEMRRIDGLNRDARLGPDPDRFDF